MNKIKPTFLLKGINPNEIKKKYIAGDYKSIKIPENKIKIDRYVIEKERDIGKNYNSEIYEYINQTNSQQRVITLNHHYYNNFKSAMLNNRRPRITGPYTCQWCRRIFKHKPLGKPIKLLYDRKKKVDIFYCEGCYCTGECVLGRLKCYTRGPQMFRRARYVDSETLLRYMFELLYPGKILGSTDNWELLDINGGPLSEKEFFSNTHRYYPTDTVFLAPIKTEYLVMVPPKLKIISRK